MTLCQELTCVQMLRMSFWCFFCRVELRNVSAFHCFWSMFIFRAELQFKCLTRWLTRGYLFLSSCSIIVSDTTTLQKGDSLIISTITGRSTQTNFRSTPLPSRPNFLHCHAVFRIIWQNNRFLVSTPSKMLDIPVFSDL